MFNSISEGEPVYPNIVTLLSESYEIQKQEYYRLGEFNKVNKVSDQIKSVS